MARFTSSSRAPLGMGIALSAKEFLYTMILVNYLWMGSKLVPVLGGV
jgi:hypothetical protein